ncbi:MAG: hypothetical protein LLF76_10015 [Planctomycetaceae bacterium]|nr:hypothetical protein [Planctomycetaceae bacterium]
MATSTSAAAVQLRRLCVDLGPQTLRRKIMNVQTVEQRRKQDAKRTKKKEAPNVDEEPSFVAAIARLLSYFFFAVFFFVAFFFVAFFFGAAFLAAFFFGAAFFFAAFFAMTLSPPFIH